MNLKSEITEHILKLLPASFETLAAQIRIPRPRLAACLQTLVKAGKIKRIGSRRGKTSLYLKG